MRSLNFADWNPITLLLLDRAESPTTSPLISTIQSRDTSIFGKIFITRAEQEMDTQLHDKCFIMQMLFRGEIIELWRPESNNSLLSCN